MRKPGLLRPADLAAEIDRYRREETGIRDLLDSLQTMIAALPGDQAELLSLWRALEAIYRAAGENAAYSEEETEETEDLLDAMDEILLDGAG
jgi:hypothetical protein